jgi:hypothetical protein
MMYYYDVASRCQCRMIERNSIALMFAAGHQQIVGWVTTAVKYLPVVVCNMRLANCSLICCVNQQQH